METKIRILTERAPTVVHQSQAVRSGDWVYVSGQIGCDPATGMLAEGLDAQTERMLANVDAVLAGAGLRKKDIAIDLIELSASELGADATALVAAGIGLTQITSANRVMIGSLQ